MATRPLLKARISLAAAGAVLGVASTPASAQGVASNTAASVIWSKSEAILGAPSALQSILAQQSGVPAGQAVQPASYSLPHPIPAVVRTFPPISEGVLSGRPDVFGSVALRVARTPLDAKWHRAENAPIHGLSLIHI